MTAPERIAVVGAGSWGTALALHLAERGPVALWARRADRAREIAAVRENRIYLPGVRLPGRVTVSSDLSACLRGAQSAVLAVPTQHLRAVLRATAALGWPAGPLVIAGKGIEVGTLAFPAAVVADVLGAAAGERTAVLSGPSFAREVAAGEPTALVAAARIAANAQAVQQAFSHARVRVYTSDDIDGVQLAGALKNVVAIAAGVAGGLGFGSNALAALVTRALAEIARLGVALGARRETFMGLAGLGDLVLTCTGALSRNRHVGYEIGRGRSIGDILAETTMVAEGVETSRAAIALAARAGAELPIAAQVHAMLFEGKDPRAALAELYARPLRSEIEGPTA